jgi:hypothetical protein
MKVYSSTQMLNDLTSQYSLTAQDIKELKNRCVCLIFTEKLNLYNHNGLLLSPRPTTFSWEEIFISSAELNKLFSHQLPCYEWNPQCHYPNKGRPLKKNSLKSLSESGKLKVDAIRVAKLFKRNLKREPTREEVAKKLLSREYKNFDFNIGTLTSKLMKSWWSS